MKKTYLVALIGIAGTLFDLQSAQEISQPTTLQEIVIREPHQNRIKRFVMYTALATGGAVAFDARFLGGRFLWKPLKRRLFPELYAQLDTIENSIQHNGQGIDANSKQLNALTEQAGRIEDTVESNGSILEQVQKSVAENGLGITENGNAITRMAKAITAIQSQSKQMNATLDTHSTTLGKLENGQQTLLQGQQEMKQLLNPQSTSMAPAGTLSFITDIPQAPSSQNQ